MEIDSGQVAYQPGQQSMATILCCSCGAPIDGTTAIGALCHDCIKTQVDISQGVQREGTLHTCRDCDRWLSPPAQWIVAEPESRELLALCMRKLRGLNKVRIIDASFIWTEPHSRRVKLKITIQQEYQGAILQQTFEVEFVVANQQCADCKKSFTHNTWRASVQVRQHVPHKRTFLYLEQLILKNQAHNNTINIKEVHEGIDFFFAHRNHAEGFVDFLKSVIPINYRKSSELISMDIHTSKKQYKFSYSVEILPICKDDLVVLPIDVSKQLGHISPLTLCWRVGTSINLMDPQTLQIADVSTTQYWRTPFKPLADVTELQEFVVLDVEPTGQTRGSLVLADATIIKASEMGSSDTDYVVRTHLGAVLHAGDSVLGYHLTGSNYNNPFFDALEESKLRDTIPDVILVKKHYPRKKKKNTRNWRLKRMAKEESEMLPRKQDQERMDRDFEMFLRDVEEDEELRQGLALYKARQEERRLKEMDVDDEEADEGDMLGNIPMNQLMDEMEDLNMNDVDDDVVEGEAV